MTIFSVFSIRELACLCFSYLSPLEVTRISRVSRQWYQCVRDEKVWQVFFEKVCPGRGELLNPTSYREAFIRFYTNLKNGLYTSSIFETGDLEPKFIALEKNTFCMIIDQGCLGGQAIVWDLLGGSKISIQLHPCQSEDWITAVALYQGALYVGYKQGKIQAWDLETGKLQGDFIGHESPISALAAGQRLYSTSGSILKIWNLQRQECVGIEDLPGMCSSLALENDLLFIGLEDGTVLAKCVTTGSVKKTFSAYDDRGKNKLGECRLRSMTSLGGFLYANSTYHGVGIWDLSAEKCANISKTSFSSLIVINDSDALLRDEKPAIGNITVRGGVVYALFLDHSVSSINKIIARDFCVSHEAVFQELSNLFKNCFYPPEGDAGVIARFKRMPKSAREKVYRELYLLIEKQHQLLGGYEKNHNFCEKAFDASSSRIKSEAISKVLTSIQKGHIQPVV